RAEGTPVSPDPDSGFKGGRYDTSNWTVEDDPRRTFSYMGQARQEPQLKLKAGKDPSVALESILSHPDRWQLECGQATQVGLLYAWSMADSEGFRKAIGSDFILRARYSSGLASDEFIVRTTPEEAFTRYKDSEEQILTKGTAELLAEAPIGARIYWENRDVPAYHDFHGENAIKVGVNLYIAQGFGPKAILTREEIEAEMARMSYKPSIHGGDFEAYK